MKIEKKIELWLSNEAFCNYVLKRCHEEVTKLMSNSRIDSIFEEMDEGLEYNEDYVVSLVDYLTYKLHYAKVLKNKKKRERIIWWFLTQLENEGFYTKVFAKYFDPLVQVTGEAVVSMLHDEYVKKQLKRV